MCSSGGRPCVGTCEQENSHAPAPVSQQSSSLGSSACQDQDRDGAAPLGWAPDAIGCGKAWLGSATQTCSLLAWGIITGTLGTWGEGQVQSSVKYVPAGDDITVIDQPGSPVVPIQPVIYTQQQKGTRSALSCPGRHLPRISSCPRTLPSLSRSFLNRKTNEWLLSKDTEIPHAYGFAVSGASPEVVKSC